GVATWKDKTKNANDAVALGTPPIVETAVVAGHDAVHFFTAAQPLGITDAVSLRFGTDEIYVVAVTKVLTLRSFFFEKVAPLDGGGSAGLEVFIANGGGTDASGFSLSPYGSLDGVSSVTWGNGNELADGKFHIVSFHRSDATHIAVSIDDALPVTAAVNATDVSAPGAQAVVGVVTAPAAADFSIAEELILHATSSAIADADIGSLHAYLKAKYGL
ncbi:MAG TPA: hypothetical protein VH054_28170, partial [Polyangiaceae bacterium]|nr:hypothetical protein [Polyangiaceae bacterium]